MALFLLDTDAVIDYLKFHTATIALIDDLFSRGETLCTCDIVIAEVFAGLYPQDEERAFMLLEPMQYLSLSWSASEQAGRWRYQFARQGIALGSQDALLAATAFLHRATLVTANIRDYPMPELSLLPLPR